jgi:hypothetical protein
VIGFLIGINDVNFPGFDTKFVCAFLAAAARLHANVYTSYRSDVRLLMDLAPRTMRFVEAVWVKKTWDPEVIHEMYYLFHKMGEALQQRVNVLLNRRCVLGIVREGLSSRIEALAAEARFIEGYVREL